VVVLVVQSASLSIRKSRPTSRCRRLATAAIFKHPLLAKVLVNVSNLANPQAPELRRYHTHTRQLTPGHHTHTDCPCTDHRQLKQNKKESVTIGLFFVEIVLVALGPDNGINLKGLQR
jgi:hypothetical protein